MELLLPDPGLIFWQTISFLILLFILGRFAWKPMLNGLKVREANIEESLKQAEEAREELKKLKSDNEALLKEAREEADKIRKDAAAAGENIRQKLEEDARKQADRMIKDAEAEIETKKQAALAEVKTQVATLSVAIAEKLLRKQLAEDGNQKELVEEFVKELNLN